MLGPGLVLGIVVVEPLLCELAFRAWMLPLAQRAVGIWPAAGLTTLAYAAAQLPTGLADAAPALLLGGINAALYLRTRSLLACTLVGALAGASVFLPVWR
jgi:membrane protease YdiL (CAAX protease family)